MSAPPTPADRPPAARPRRRRSRWGGDDGETFGQFTPWTNPAAVYAYAASLIGMAPVLGVLFGPAAVLLGLVGLARRWGRPEVDGTNFAVAAIVLGALDTAFNVAGLWLIAAGLTA
jgi:hypothetical protein